MAAATDAPVVESVNLAEAVALISEAAEDPAVPEASQERRPCGLRAGCRRSARCAGRRSRRVCPPTRRAADRPPKLAKRAQEAAAEMKPRPISGTTTTRRPGPACRPSCVPCCASTSSSASISWRRKPARPPRSATRRCAWRRPPTPRSSRPPTGGARTGQAFHQAFVDRWSRVDWKALAEKDPAEVGRLMQQRQEEETLLAEATRRGEADIAAAQAQAEKELEEARRVESAKLAAKLPEWFGTPQVAQRTWDDLRRYLFGKGIAGRSHHRGLRSAQSWKSLSMPCASRTPRRWPNASAKGCMPILRRRRVRASGLRRRLRRACPRVQPTSPWTARRMPFARPANASAEAAAPRSPTPPS